MGREGDVYGTLGSQVTINPGDVAEVLALSGQLAVNIKMISGTTLEIGGPTGATGQTFGLMYPIASTEVVSMNMSGKFYLWASGTTAVVAILKGRSQGY